MNLKRILPFIGRKHHTPHVGVKQQRKLNMRALMDARAAAMNYPGWCGRGSLVQANTV